MKNSTAQPPEYIVAATCAELPPGGRKVIEIAGQAILLLNVQGKFFALGNLCPHDNNPLEEGFIDAQEITCPWHGARFALATGQALSFPAVTDLPAYPVKVEDDKILVQVNSAH